MDMMKHISRKELKWLIEDGYSYELEYDGDYGELEILYLKPTKTGCCTDRYSIVRHEVIIKLRKLGFNLTYIHQAGNRMSVEFLR